MGGQAHCLLLRPGSLMAALCRLDVCRVHFCCLHRRTCLRNRLQRQMHSHQGVPALWPVQAGGLAGFTTDTFSSGMQCAGRLQLSVVSIQGFAGPMLIRLWVFGGPAHHGRPKGRYCMPHAVRRGPRALQAATLATLFLISAG